MKVILRAQLVTDWGDITEVDVAEFSRPARALDAATLGLSLTDGKMLLERLQQAIAGAQADELCELHRVCQSCHRRSLLAADIGKIRWCLWHNNLSKLDTTLSRVLLMCRIVVPETPGLKETLERIDYRNSRSAVVRFEKFAQPSFLWAPIPEGADNFIGDGGIGSQSGHQHPHVQAPANALDTQWGTLSRAGPMRSLERRRGREAKILQRGQG